MSIFGIQSPKFKNSSAVDVDMDYARVERDEALFDTLVQASKIDGSRTFINKEYGWAFEVLIHLHKEGNDTARLAKYNTYNSNLYDLVTLYRHRDNEPIKDSNGDEVPFLFAEIYMGYLNNPPQNLNEPGDYLILKFIHTKNIRLQQSASPPPPASGSEVITETQGEQTIITETGGQEIIVE